MNDEVTTLRDDGARSPSLVKFHAPEVVFGPGSLAEVGFAAARLGARRPFLVTDEGVARAGWAHEAVDHLERAGLRPQVWSEVTPNPKDHEVAAGFERYLRTGADVIVAVGGGSVMDAAKGIAILAGNGGSILDYEGIDQIAHPIPPMLMVPSTAGTGADVSQFCVVSDTVRRVKVSIVGRALVPDISITDPRLLTTMPAELTAATGFDALSHGVEAFVSLAHNPLSDLHALNAVRLVAAHLVHTIHHPDDLDARHQMAQASLEAGIAFSNAILGATHAMSHQVGGLLDAPHGIVNAVLLSHVIRFNALTSPERYRVLAGVLALPEAQAPAAEMAEALAVHMQSLAVHVGAPRGLAALGVTADDIPLLSRSAVHDACLTTNPRPADAADVERIFQAAL